MSDSKRAARLLAALGAIGMSPAAHGAVTRHWVGLPFGTWSVASNWSPAGVPAAGDNVQLDIATSANVVIFDVNSLLVTPVLFQTVSIAPGTSATMTLTNGGFHNLTADNFNVFPRGTYTQQPSGFASVGIANLSGGTMNLSGGRFTVTNTFNMGGGILSFTGNSELLNNGAFDFLAGSVFENGGTFTNNGLLFLENSNPFNVWVENHGTIVFNASSAKFDVFFNYADVTLNATRALTTSRNNITQVSGTFTNLGDVTSNLFVGSGTWDQRGGSLNSGIVTLGANANDSATFVQFGGSVTTPFLILGGSFVPGIVGGAGRYSISGGSLSVSTLIIGSAEAAGGSFTQTGGLTRVSTASGTCSLVINEEAASNGNLTITGGTFEVLRNSSQFAAAVNHGLITQTGGVSRFEEQILGSGDIAIGGSASMSLGSGTASLFQIDTGRIRQGAIVLSGNARLVQLRPSSLPAPTASRVQSLTFDETSGSVHGTWDVRSMPLVIDYSGASSPLNAVRRYLRSGFANGSWNGTGLTSNTAAASAAHNTGLGFGEASIILGAAGGVFEGLGVDDSAVLIRITLYGDANLDGKVDVSDLGALATNWQTANVWSGGDFNYDGFVDVSDLGALATNWQAQLDLASALAASGLPDLRVPEPAGVTLLMVVGFARRRRRTALPRSSS